jgi:hypothetical protein
MATGIGSTFLNLIDVYRRTEDGQQIATVLELLHQINPVLEDAIAVECNMGAVHRHTVRTGLPDVAWGRLYQGIPQSKSTTQQVDDTTGFLEALSTIDERLLALSPGNQGALRLSEAMAFLEAMSQEMASGIFYSDTKTTPEQFKGLGARYGVSGGGGAGNQIVKAGGSGNANSSIWFVTWSEQTTMLLYPKGTKAGVNREDMGRQRVLDGSNNPYYVQEEKFSWHIGMSVKDWRYNARVANIDTAAAVAGTVDIYSYLANAYYLLQSRRAPLGGKQVIYMNRTILAALDKLATPTITTSSYAGALQLRRSEVEGQEVVSYRGIPIRECDALLTNEANVA